MKNGRIVKRRVATRGDVFPANRFDERGRPFEGLDRIVKLFGDPYPAWAWLTTELASLDGAKPLTLPPGGEIDRVVQAAEGYRQGDFT